MSEWRERLWRMLGFGLERPAAASPAPEVPAPAVDPPSMAIVTAERALDVLVRELAARAPHATGHPHLAADRHLEALHAAGRPRLAAGWLDKLAAAAPDGALRDGLRARAAALHAELGDATRALPHLEALLRAPAHAAFANLLLGEHHERAGDLRRALRHYEAVLAIDVDHPSARARAAALATTARPRTASTPAAADVTLVGPDGSPAVAGARYHLLRELGRGATGAVYLARDVTLGRDVALKLFHAGAGASALGRFFAEARVAAALRHPDIVAVLDVDEVHRFIVMECCRGGTLAARLRKGPLTAAVALAHHLEVLSALAAAHRRGVVHRDLKPANLLFRREAGAAVDDEPADVVLCDFGVAHLLGDTPGERAPVGTWRYMSPEQRRGEISPAADIFAAGVILSEMLTGPVEGSPLGARAFTAPASLPPELRGHVAQLAAADPAARPDAAAGLAVARNLLDRTRVAAARAQAS